MELLTYPQFPDLGLVMVWIIASETHKCMLSHYNQPSMHMMSVLFSGLSFETTHFQIKHYTILEKFKDYLDIK